MWNFHFVFPMGKESLVKRSDPTYLMLYQLGYLYSSFILVKSSTPAISRKHPAVNLQNILDICKFISEFLAFRRVREIPLFPMAEPRRSRRPTISSQRLPRGLPSPDSFLAPFAIVQHGKISRIPIKPRNARMVSVSRLEVIRGRGKPAFRGFARTVDRCGAWERSSSGR